MQRLKKFGHLGSWLLMVVMLGFWSTALFGQNADFTGQVTDASGAVVLGAQVVVRNQDTNVESETKTNKAGAYTVPYLIPGLYALTVKAPGFKTETKINIGLQAAQDAVVDFTLSVGEVSTSVTVDAAGSLLDKGSATRGEEMENARVTELPLNGRNPVMLDRLNSSVIWNGNLIWQRPFDGQVWTNLDINGSGNYNTEIMLDGQPDQTPRPQNGGHTNGGYVAPDDAVQDFKIVTNPYDAQYGQTRGGVIDMDLKSGTNQIHGDVYEYMRRTWLDANWWVNDAEKVLNPTKAATGLYNTPQHKLDQYGAELDGPVMIPGIFNGRDKLFFVAQVENWNEIEPAYADTSVPEPQWANGDFSGLTYNGAPVTIYNPYSTYACTENGAPQICRNPFPNNQIPTNMLNPTAQAYLKLYPAPNQPGESGTPWQQNYYAQEPTVDIYRNALIKLDWAPTPKDRFMLRYGYWERYETDISNGITSGPGGYGEDPLGDRAHTFATQWTHTFTPNLLLNFMAGVDVKAEIADVAPTGFNATTIGWPSSLTSQLGAFSMLPGMNPSGFTGIGDTGAGNGLTTTDALNLFPSITWLKGRHTLRAGLDWRIGQYAIVLNAGTEANLSFSTQWTQNCWSCGAGSDYVIGNENTEGNAIASMLLGLGSGGTDEIGSTAFYSEKYYAPWFQDDWKVTPKLTLNLGVRYDLQPYYTERHNRTNYAFDTTTINPVDAMIPFHTLATGQSFVDKGGVTFAGVNGNPRQAYSTNLTEIQPRLGFAYAVTDKTVLRGGVGEVFQQTDAFPALSGFSSSTSYVNSPNGGLTPINAPNFGGNLSDPFPSIVQPTGSSLGLLTSMGNGPSYLNPKFQIPNVWQFSFGVEQRFTRNDTMELSYVGNRAPNNETSQNINHWNGTQEAACNVQMGGRHEVCDDTYGSGNTSSSDSTAVLGYVPNPYYHVAAFAGSTPYGQVTRQALNWTEPMPEFGGVTEYQWNGAHSWYNSLQLTLQHRLSHELTVHGTWTWSKLMDAGGWADNNYLIPYRGIDTLDRTHNATISMVWDLPVGRGRLFGTHMNRVADAVIGGWEFASMAMFQSGAPYPAPSGWDYVSSAKIKPHFVSNGNIQWYAPCYWNTNSETGALSESAEALSFGCSHPDFIQIPSYGATPDNNLNLTDIREQFQVLDDSNLSKNFQLKERLRLQLRLETFNTFNHPLFSGGAYNGINQYAGQIGATTGGGQSNKPRYTQLAAKLVW
jgi:hypothetical protein